MVMMHAISQVLGSIRACATAYPTKVAEGLLWVWASSGPNAEAESAAAEWKGLCGVPDDEGGDVAFDSNQRWYFRDIPTGYISNKENSFNDPSHGADEPSLTNYIRPSRLGSDEGMRIPSSLRGGSSKISDIAKPAVHCRTEWCTAALNGTLPH